MKKEFVSSLLRLLRKHCGGCGVQYGGCPCRTCFYSMTDELGLSDKRAHEFWKVVLILRGDYKEEEMIKSETTQESD